MRIRYIFVALYLQWLLSGCAVLNGSYFQSKNTLEIYDSNRDRIVINDIVRTIQGYIPPARTTLYIDTKASHANQDFTVQIEAALRSVGYGVSREYRTGMVAFSWKIDMVATTMVRATYLLGDTKLTRFYKADTHGYRPFGAFTVLGLGKPRYKIAKTPVVPDAPSLQQSPQKRTYAELATDSKHKKTQKAQSQVADVVKVDTEKHTRVSKFQNRINSEAYQSRWRN